MQNVVRKLYLRSSETEIIHLLCSSEVLNITQCCENKYSLDFNKKSQNVYFPGTVNINILTNHKNIIVYCLSAPNLPTYPNCIAVKLAIFPTAANKLFVDLETSNSGTNQFRDCIYIMISGRRGQVIGRCQEAIFLPGRGCCLWPG